MRTRKKAQRFSWNLLLRLIVGALLAATIACCANESPPAPGDSQGSEKADSTDGNSQRDPDGGVARPVKPNIVIIDVQKLFVQMAANDDMDAILQRIVRLLILSAKKNLPLHLTYEDAKTGDHALEPSLATIKPSHAQEYIKTTFAATGQPVFAEAMQAAAPAPIAVVGAETDVCVLQTVLGLRRMGREVILLRDAVFTSEPHTSPAIKRMSQAGVTLATVSAFEEALASGSVEAIPFDPPILPTGKIAVLDPAQVAVVVIDPQQAAVDGAAPTYKEARLVRLEQLLVVSDWLQLPCFLSVGTAGQALHPRLTAVRPPQTQEFHGVSGSSLPAGLLQAVQGSGATQVVLAGIDVNGSLQRAAKELMNTGYEVFLVEDASLSTSLVGSILDALYTEGIIPLTHKSFYYGMLKSVDSDEWASAQWLKRAIDRFDDLLVFPEDLPPIAD